MISQYYKFMEDGSETFEKKTNSYEVGYCKPPISPGRPAGVPNKSTIEAKAAIALYVESNVQRLQEWLDMIAGGYEYEDAGADGKPIKKRVAPRPERAYELFMSVVEYHVPKLTRTEVRATVNHNTDYELKAQTPEEAAREYQNLVQ